jgi:nucleoside-diphosphate-sugar epimerase
MDEMRIFIAGAGGAVGRRMVPMLLAEGHEVVGTTHSAGKADAIRRLGAEPVVLDAFDAQAVRQAVAKAAPDAVVHQMTALSGPQDLRRFDRTFALTNRLRTEGTDILLAAARSAGTRRFVVQSFTGWTNERTGGPVKTEADPFDPNPTASTVQTMAAIRQLESTVEGAKDVGGIVLRYGLLYGPGTSIGTGGDSLELVRKRRMPVVGGGTGVWSFLHVEDAASAAVVAIDSTATGIYNIVDNDPAPASQWLPYLAEVIGAKPPMRVPGWLVAPMVGGFLMEMMTSVRGSSNAKARRDLGWQPRYGSWRVGFREGLD